MCPLILQLLDSIYLETAHSLRSLLSSLPCQTLDECILKFNMISTQYFKIIGILFKQEDAYSWASWTSGALLAIFSMHSLQESYSIYQVCSSTESH